MKALALLDAGKPVGAVVITVGAVVIHAEVDAPELLSRMSVGLDMPRFLAAYLVVDSRQEAVTRVVSPNRFRLSRKGLCQSGQTTYPGYSVARSAMSGVLAADALMGDH